MKNFKVSTLIGTRTAIEKAKQDVVESFLLNPLISINLKCEGEMEVECSHHDYQTNVDLFANVMIQFGRKYSEYVGK